MKNGSETTKRNGFFKMTQLLSGSLELILAKHVFLTGSMASFKCLHPKNENIYARMQHQAIMLYTK